LADIKLKGTPVHTVGNLPAVGGQAPDVTLVAMDLSEKSLHGIPGKKVLNIFPSIDTGVCATSVRTFNQKATELSKVTVVNVSMDLPFALKRFCAAEGIERVLSLSAFRSDFGAKYGVTIQDGKMTGLFSRAVVVLDEQNRVVHAEQVPDIGQEPDYAAALSKL
jgi:thiol peroxidase